MIIKFTLTLICKRFLFGELEQILKDFYENLVQKDFKLIEESHAPQEGVFTGDSVSDILLHRNFSYYIYNFSCKDSFLSFCPNNYNLSFLLVKNCSNVLLTCKKGRFMSALLKVLNHGILDRGK